MSLGDNKFSTNSLGAKLTRTLAGDDLSARKQDESIRGLHSLRGRNNRMEIYGTSGASSTNRRIHFKLGLALQALQPNVGLGWLVLCAWMAQKTKTLDAVQVACCMLHARKVSSNAWRAAGVAVDPARACSSRKSIAATLAQIETNAIREDGFAEPIDWACYPDAPVQSLPEGEAATPSKRIIIALVVVVV